MEKESSDDRASDLNEKVGASMKAPEAASKNGKAEAAKEVIINANILTKTICIIVPPRHLHALLKLR